jgi:spermidine synthase
MGLFLLFGFYSLLAQALLLRETAQVFGAHELSLASALAFWLLWTAVGVRLGGRAAGERAFAGWALVFAATAPLNLLLARLAPGQLPPMGQPGLFTMLAGSALLCLPAALANGCAAGAALRGRPAYFYAAEAAGAAAAGVLTIFYYRSFPGLEAAAVLAAPALLLAAAYALRPFSARRAAAAAFAVILMGAANVLAPAAWTLKPPAPRPGSAAQTEAGRLAFAGASVYEDGRLIHSAEDTAPEELAHIPLLALDKPGDILLHGGGAFFLLPEVLKHKPSSVEIAEPDRFRAAALARSAAAQQGKYTPLYSDPRALTGREGRYSAIFNASGAPENAAQNRFYTTEYFRKAAALLRPGGLLVFQLPFAENYLPPQAAYAAACVLSSARSVFTAVELIPGARLTVLASDAPFRLDPAQLAAEYSRRKIKTRTVVPSALPFILHPYRRAWAEGELAKVRRPPQNTDLNPLAYFRFWRAWLSMVLSPAALLGLAALALAGLYAAFRIKDLLQFSPGMRTGEAFLMGFWGLAFETAVLLSFQARTGRLSPELGAMFALFMAGAAAGAWAARNSAPKAVLLFEAAAAVLALAAALRPELAQAAWGARFLILAGGFLSGAFFAAAAGETGGAVYSWDLIGGAAGGFTAAAFAAPLAGITGTLYFASAVALCALAGGVLVSIRRGAAGG